MFFKFMVFLAIVCAIGFLPVNAVCENTAQKELPVFTNQDIEKYRNPSDTKKTATKTDRTSEKSEKSQKIKEEREQEYWCKKATQYNRKIEMLQDEVKEREKELSDLKDPLSQGTPGKKKSIERNIKSTQKKLDGARKRLKYAEKDLAEIEDEAHRKDIPPGWLRCQFE